MSADGTIPEARTSASTSSWYTPAAIVEAARLALGGRISLDPASCATANATVKADVYHAEVFDGPECSTVDGLSVPWFGTVFLNPPSPPRPWWKKLRGEIEAGRVSKAVITYTDEPSPETGHVGWCWWAMGSMGDAPSYEAARDAAVAEIQRRMDRRMAVL